MVLLYFFSVWDKAYFPSLEPYWQFAYQPSDLILGRTVAKLQCWTEKYFAGGRNTILSSRWCSSFIFEPCYENTMCIVSLDKICDYYTFMCFPPWDQRWWFLCRYVFPIYSRDVMLRTSHRIWILNFLKKNRNIHILSW